MNGRVNLLSVLLALQLVIIGVVLVTETGFGDPEQGPFLSFDAGEVDEIRITGDDEDAATLMLTRGEAGWSLPEGLPADGNKVRDVLDKLAGLSSPWPVATSSSAAERFQVTAEDYQRHVVLAVDGGTVADLYLGTSPGYQQVHARRANDEAVYSVGISNYQLPAGADEWLDKTLLQPEGEISAVHRQDAWELSRGEDGWLLGDAAADQEAAADLVRRLSELRVTGAAEAPEAERDATAVLEVSDTEGAYQLSIFSDEEGNEYQVRSDRVEGVFALAAYVAEQLLVEKPTLLAAQGKQALDSEDADDPAADEPSPGAPAADQEPSSPAESGEPGD